MNKFLRFGNSVIYIFLLSTVFAVHNSSFAQVKFSAVCPNKQIGKNEYLQLQYVVENASNVEEIIPPSFKNFSVISGPNQQSSMTNINGAVKQSVALEFILKPDGPGKYTFPAATAKVNGKILQSNTLSVQVTNNSGSSSSGGTSISPFSNMMMDVIPATPVHQYDDYILHKGERLPEKIKKNLFVKLDVNKTSCYVGEPIVATYKLYTRLKSESNMVKSPSFNGFSVSEMEVPESYSLRTEKYNGREYSVYILRKVQLYPLQPGDVILDAVEVENHITFIKAEYANAARGDIFFDMLRDFADARTPAEGMEQQKITLQSTPLTITVKPLPDAGKPVNFKGAVGNFTIGVSTKKNNMTTDEAGNLTISLTGSGNMEMINAPEIIWPDGVEAFEPKSTESIDKTTVPLRGKKTFDYSFTVSAPGKYTIPAITFSYFDINTHNYKTVSTTPVTIDVKKGIGIRPAIPGQVKNVAAPASEGNSFNWPWMLLIAAFITAGSIIWFAGKTEKRSSLILSNKNVAEAPAEQEQKNDIQILKNYLQDAEAMLAENDTGNFYYTLNNCVRNFLAIKLNYSEKELSKKKINELLDKHNVGIGTTIMLLSLLENIEVNLYAPASSAGHMQDAYQKASEVVSLLDKQIT